MLIKGENRVITHRETSADGVSNFVPAADTWALDYTEPDGVTTELNYTVTITPPVETESIYRDFSARIVDLKYGIYTAVWKFEVGDTPTTETYRRPEKFFVASMDVWSAVRELLVKTPAQLSDAVIDRELTFIIRKLERDHSCLGPNGHASIADSELYYFDTALAYLVAARYYLSHKKDFAFGAIRKQVQGPISWEYSTPATPKAGVVPIEDVWLAEAFDQLNLVSCFAARLEDYLDGIEHFSTSGPRRGVQEAGPRFGINELYIIAKAEQEVWVR